MIRTKFIRLLCRTALWTVVCLCAIGAQGAAKYTVTITAKGSEAALAGVTAAFPQTKQFEAGKKVSFTLPVNKNTFSTFGRISACRQGKPTASSPSSPSASPRD